MLELLTNAEMRRADALAVEAGVPSLELMENAGRAVADAVSANFGTSWPIVVAAGTGNNGGDGFVAARHLMERGCDVRVVILGNRTALSGDAQEMAQRYRGPEAQWKDDGEFSPNAVVVDAIFGAGLSRPVDGAAAALIKAINRSRAYVISVDLPSGIHGDTGSVMGCAVAAHRTVTFFRRKPGHVLLPGRQHCGLTTIADIGIPGDVLATILPRVSVNQPGAWQHAFPVPQATGHKYSRGHAVVLSGAMASTGAARLAARGALRAGAGLVTLASPADAVAVNAASSLAVMVREAEGAAGLASLLDDPRISAVILGPGAGVGTETRAKVKVAAAGDRGLVLDADALTSFGENPNELFTILANHKLSTAILTPHDGEFSRLFSRIDRIPSVKQKLEAAVAASHETAAVVILKGGDTVVAAPDGRALIAENAPAYLATAGAGDVLAGIAGGLRAQRMPAFEAAAAAVWLHGEAAREAGPGMIAEDLTEALPKVYRRLFSAIARRSDFPGVR
jgi:hydroxyethylthiazole kinase-like uncharacterized protein yjeF